MIKCSLIFSISKIFVILIFNIAHMLYYKEIKSIFGLTKKKKRTNVSNSINKGVEGSIFMTKWMIKALTIGDNYRKVFQYTVVVQFSLLRRIRGICNRKVLISVFKKKTFPLFILIVIKLLLSRTLLIVLLIFVFLPILYESFQM